MPVNKTTIDDKLYELQKFCNRYAETDCLAPFVTYAFNWYIGTNRWTRQFEENFLNYPEEKFDYLVRRCLNGDRSHEGIINTAKKDTIINKDINSL